MAKIIINRKGEWMNRLRKFQVYVDGEKVGEIKNGSAEEFMVSAGHHSLQCKMGRYCSNFCELTTGESDVKFLAVRSNLKFFWVFYSILLVAILAPLVARFLKVQLPENFETFRIGVLILVICYFLYYTLFRKNSYLSLAEDDKNIFNS
jgi:hypothetical protein